jgi:excisionase family DNA binding protein
MVATMTERNAYSADEIAKRNGVSRAFVWKQMKEGKLAYRKVGSRRLILAEDERAWLGNTGATVQPRLGETLVYDNGRNSELDQ